MTNEEAKAEWDAHKRIHDHFKNGFQTYLELRPDYQAHGIANAAEFLAKHIVNVAFFEKRSPAHDGMRNPLQQAEKKLKDHNVTPVIESFWSFVPRKISGGGLSLHAVGRAFDINPRTNPHVKSYDEILLIQAATGFNLAQLQGAADMRRAISIQALWML